MPLVLGSNSVSGGYNVANSLRFNSDSSDYLNRTFGSPTNNKIFTFSFWIKRGDLAREQFFFNGAAASQFYINNQDKLYYYDQTAGGTYKTTQVFRDVSAWYHIVVAEDTTQATAGDRVKIYVNGIQITAFDIQTNPTQNNSSAWNTNATAYYIGRYNPSPSGYYYSGYMSEFYFIDGQQLDPTYFGETDTDTNIWKPIPYTGSFGTNGFYLEFQNSASLGTDSSGNGNNFTVNNLTSIDQSTDTCTNNFCTWNSLNKHASSTVSDGNLTYTTSGTSQFEPAQCTIGFSAGKWYCEHKVNSIGATGFLLGIFKTSVSGMVQSEMDTARFAYNLVNGDIAKNASNIQTGLATFTTNDILGIAVNITNGTLIFYKNGSQVGTTITDSDITNNEWTFGVQPRLCGFSSNFGSPPYSANSYADAEGFGNFSYAVPAGYFALCSKNLAEYG